MKFTQPASTAPGSWSVGMMRPVMASSVFHCAASRTAGSWEAEAAAAACGRGTFSEIQSPPP